MDCSVPRARRRHAVLAKTYAPRAPRSSRRRAPGSGRAGSQPRSRRDPGRRGSSAEEALEVAQVVGEGRGGHGEYERHGEGQAFARLPPAPGRPRGEPRAEHDRGRDEQAMKGDHALSSTISVRSAGRYTIDTRKRRHARGFVAASVIAIEAPAYASPRTSAPKQSSAPVTPSKVRSRHTGSRSPASNSHLRP